MLRHRGNIRKCRYIGLFCIHQVCDVPFENHASKKSSFTMATIRAESNHEQCPISSKNSVFLPTLSPSIAIALKRSSMLVEAWVSIVYQPQTTDLYTRAVWADKALSQTGNAVSRLILCLLLPTQSAFLPVTLEDVARGDYSSYERWVITLF